jgi:glucose/arabinose dehydrogenase
MKKFWPALGALLITVGTAFAAPGVADPNLQVHEVVAGLNAPTTMAFIGPGDILVLQKNDGRVRRVIAGVLQAAEVLDVKVDRASERGLLGIAVHPNFPASPFIYLYFTESSTGSDSSGSAAGNRVYRYTWDGVNNRLTSPTLILDLPVTPGPNHDGGVLAFGPDGKLYVMIGDLNRNGQLQNNSGGAAPDDTSVILRLNDDGTTPADNPFFALGGNAARYYAYGIRNSFGMAFDPETEELWITENGPSSYDEINLVAPGFNSGWNKMMGPDSRNGQDVSDLFALAGSHYADPKFSWLTPVGVTGIVFLDSIALGAEYQGDAFVGDVNNGNLYRFRPNGARDGFIFNGAGLADGVADSNNQLKEVIFGTGFNGITDLKIGPDGLLYVVSIGDGKIYVVMPAGPEFTDGSRLPSAEVGVLYNEPLDIFGGTPPYIVTIVKGSLPAGLNLVAGAITGTPTQAEESAFTLQLTDNAGAIGSEKFKIKVLKAVGVTTKNLEAGKTGKKYKVFLKAIGGKKPFNWALIAGALPAGLILDPATGKLSGIPAVAVAPNLTFRVTDSLGGTAQKSFTLTIEP